jgi:hypothetical protein
MIFLIIFFSWLGIVIFFLGFLKAGNPHRDDDFEYLFKDDSNASR